MQVKRSKFWTFIFSFLPGAGEMFMGFTKRGLSLMAAFFLTLGLSSWLNIGVLGYLAPVIWFFSFFDCINIAYSKDEVFAELRDEYLFINKNVSIGDWISKHKMGTGISVIILGVYILFSNVLRGLNHAIGALPPYAYNMVTDITNAVPQVAVSLLIIIAGVLLIKGKKKELKQLDDK